MSEQLEAILVIGAACAAGSFIKGATGQGLPQIAIPVMASFLGVESAVVIMAIPGVVTNSWLLWSHRDHYHRTRDLPVLLATGIAGAVAGTFLLRALDEDILALVLAGLILIYVTTFFARPGLRLSEAFTRKTSPPVGLAAGVLQGATGISGPIISTYVHSFRLDKEVYVLSITTVFQVFAIVQALTLAVIGLYTEDRLLLSFLALIPIMAALPLGTRFTSRLSRRTFDRLIIVMLLASAMKLIYDGLT